MWKAQFNHRWNEKWKTRTTEGKSRSKRISRERIVRLGKRTISTLAKPISKTMLEWHIITVCKAVKLDNKLEEIAKNDASEELGRQQEWNSLEVSEPEQCSSIEWK